MSEVQNTDFSVTGGELLLFLIDNCTYGIEIQYITEIIEIEQITVIPKVPDYIKGVINLRGKVVPIMSVRRRFGKEEIPYDARTCIIVIEWQGTSVGLIVDRVREVVSISPDQISETPNFKNVNSNKYIKSVIESGDEIRLLLDCQRIIES